MNKGLTSKLTTIQCLFYDFDGVMTDNRVWIFPDGSESVVCNRGDGWAVRRLRDFGLRQYILTTEENIIVQKRAEKLKIPRIVAADDKKRTLEVFAKKNKIDLRRCAYFGNDQNDWDAMKLVGLTIAPADAWKPIKKMADIVTSCMGGHGVLREFLDYYESARNSLRIR